MSLFGGGPSAVPALDAARQRRWGWTVGILVMLALLLLASRPLYRVGKQWRGRALAAEAEKLMAAKKWQEAAGKAQAAFQLAPGEPSVLRAAAHLYSGAGSPMAAGYWKALFQQQSAATLADRREAAQLALQLQQFDFAQEQVDLLLKTEPVSSEILLLAAQLAARKGDRTGALALTARLLAQNPEHALGALFHAQLLFSSPDPPSREAGKRALQKMANTLDPTAISALVTLAADPGLSREEIQAVANALELKSSAVEHQLLIATLRLRVVPDQKTTIIDQAVARFRNQGPEAVVSLARWLLQQGEPGRVLTVIPLPDSLRRQELFLVRIDALAALQQWAEIQQILEKEKVPIEPFYAEIFLARAAQELNDDRGTELHWSRAFLAARLKPPLLIYLAQYAEKVHQMDVAEKSWRELARNPTFTLRAQLALVPIVEAQHDTRALREVIREIVRLSPNDPAPGNDAAYLDLLLGENMDASRQTAEKLVHDHPEVLAYRTTLALAHLRAGDPKGAQRVYEGMDLAWEDSPPSAQAVRLATMMANGEDVRAQNHLKALPVDLLKTEERALLAPAK